MTSRRRSRPASRTCVQVKLGRRSNVMSKRLLSKAITSAATPLCFPDASKKSYGGHAESAPSRSSLCFSSHFFSAFVSGTLSGDSFVRAVSALPNHLSLRPWNSSSVICAIPFDRIPVKASSFLGTARCNGMGRPASMPISPPTFRLVIWCLFIR